MKRRHKKREPASSVVREDPPEYGAAPPRFIDLFCGIGGFRIAFERAGGRCVFSSDYDKFSQQTYEANFGEKPHGDIHGEHRAAGNGFGFGLGTERSARYHKDGSEILLA